MGLEANCAGHLPEISPTAYVHPTATIIGRVCVSDRVFIGPSAVLRADETGPDGEIAPILLGECVNVQDCAIIHALGGTGVTIGARTSVSHAAVVHGPCEIGADCFVGFTSVIFRAALADGVVVMHKALVEGASVSEGLFVPSMTAVCCQDDVRQLKRVPQEVVAFAQRVVSANMRLADAAVQQQRSR